MKKTLLLRLDNWSFRTMAPLLDGQVMKPVKGCPGDGRGLSVTWTSWWGVGRNPFGERMKLQRFGLLLCLALASCGVATGVSTCLATCSGCCTTQGICMRDESDTVCGVAGRLCVDCTTYESTCDLTRHACRGSPDGGSSVCSPSCGGCCAPTSLGNVCLPLSGQSATACGSNGQSCVSCGSGRVCILGECANVQSTSIGEACSEDSTCSNRTGSTSCRKETADGKYRYPDGYCTRPCNQEDCGPQAACADNLTGESAPLCLTSCDAPGTAMGCRVSIPSMRST